MGARRIGLEVALTTTGDELSLAFLQACAPAIDLISLPLDGASEEVSSRTKKPGHFTALLQALEWLREFPNIDVKLCTPVTRHNLEDVPNIARLAEEYAETTQARVFYNIFQTFRRSMDPPDGKACWSRMRSSPLSSTGWEKAEAATSGGRACLRKEDP